MEGKRRRRSGRRTAIAVCMVLIGVAAVLLLCYRLFLGQTYQTEDVNKYGEFAGFNELYSRLEVFPEGIPEDTQKSDYYYWFRDEIFSPRCQIYLKCEYTKEEYAKEKERLELLAQQEYDAAGITELDADRTAYILVYDEQRSFEYAVVEEDTDTITYIYLKDIQVDEVVFDKSLLL